jgi:hypothetical protein
MKYVGADSFGNAQTRCGEQYCDRSEIKLQQIDEVAANRYPKPDPLPTSSVCRVDV